MTNKKWEHFEIETGFCVKGTGASKREAFENAAMSVASLVIDPNIVRGLNGLFIDCEAENDEDLLEYWINSIIREMEDRKMIFAKFHVYLEKPKLRGQAWGEPIDSRRHKLLAKLSKTKKEDRIVRQISPHIWLAQCGIDLERKIILN
mgnify:CR=1 FL=1|jgi:SHS2 domain-containing protein